MKAKPLARQSSLVVKELEDETLIYDPDTDKAHCLNLTAARIWKSCDGKSTVPEIAKRIGTETETAVDENLVWIALDKLEKFKLLEQPVEKPAWLSTNVGRRQVIRTIGVAAIVSPIITSIFVPMASAQGPCIPPGGNFCCKDPKDCCCPPSNPTCCEQLPVADPPCFTYPPNPQSSGKRCIA